MTKEEALKVANEMRQWFKTDREKEALETLIPELKESEDERIRKEIIGYLNSKVATAEETELLYFKRWISYLENLKPSFRQIHDSVMWDSGLRTGIELGKKKEQEPVSFNEPYNPDDYEVVMQGNATSIRRKQQKEQKPVSISCGHENDAEWSEEDETHRDFILELLEDQIRFCKKNAEGAYYANQIRTAQNWLNALPLRIKKNNEDTAKLCSNEWTDEDEMRLNHLITFVEKYGLQFYASTDKVIEWLKSRRPQPKDECGKLMINGEPVSTEPKSVHVPQWKPTGEQLHAMEAALRFVQCNGVFYQKDIHALESLFYKLKDMYDNNKA